MLQRRNLVSANDKTNKPRLAPADFSLVEIETRRGPQKTGVEHVSVPVRRVLARALARYRDRIGNGEP
jgi:hypothetical protein